MELESKNIVYIGGFGGIGQKCLYEFLKKKVKNLIIFDLNENSEMLQELQQLFPSSNVVFIRLDITSQQSVSEAYKEAFDKIGPFDVVINGSGLMNDRLINETVQINLLGPIHSTLTAVKYMDQSAGGRGGLIVNISSVLGLDPHGFFAIYSATKCGVAGFTRALADPLYFARTGIGFITICPGFTDTPLLNSPHGKGTLELSASMVDRFFLMKRQTASECARNLVKAVELAKNGSIWLLDMGQLKELQMPVFWKPTLKNADDRE